MEPVMHIAVNNDVTSKHRTVEPAILYFGTPVVLIGSTNEDGTHNLAPMSSAWWLGWRCMLGLDMRSKSTENMLRTGECVLNLPSADMAAAVDRLARTTGSDPMPGHKVKRGYRTEKDKFGAAHLTAVDGETVASPRVAECPVQLEAKVEGVHHMAAHDPKARGSLAAIEVIVTRIHIHESLLMDTGTDRVDPDKWRPLIMSFQQFYGLAPGRLHRSELGEIPEEMYRPAARL
jgi:flavin reductase (DIM6/NTAB) family NADH-FMN oxidoreductase RutF